MFCLLLPSKFTLLTYANVENVGKLLVFQSTRPFKRSSIAPYSFIQIKKQTRSSNIRMTILFVFLLSQVSTF